MMDRGGGVRMMQGEERVGRVGVVPFNTLDMNFLHLCILDNSIFLG